jgi:hypothetical protein
LARFSWLKDSTITSRCLDGSKGKIFEGAQVQSGRRGSAQGVPGKAERGKACVRFESSPVKRHGLTMEVDVAGAEGSLECGYAKGT